MTDYRGWLIGHSRQFGGVSFRKPRAIITRLLNCFLSPVEMKNDDLVQQLISPSEIDYRKIQYVEQNTVRRSP